MDEKLKVYDDKMTKTINNLGSELAAIRAGRANPHVLDKLTVDYYGVPTPIQQAANVSVPETRLIHFIGKDNIVFHCIVFPAMLKAEGSYILPDNVPSNEFLNLEGDKISTSRNWAVWLHEYLADFPGKQDVLRYVLTANAPETKDNDFT